MVLKTLFRSPLKAMLTFLLIAAASFALFSRATDYAVTMREIARAESFCKGVAALDNTASYVILQGAGSGQVSDYTAYEVGARPWPSNGQIAEFSSLPGVTLADTRYMTAGLVGGYKRLVDESASVRGRFVIEGTYAGCDYTPGTTGVMKLAFDDVRVVACDDDGIDLGSPIEAIAVDDQTYYDNPYPAAYFEKLEKGSRCLVMGTYGDIHKPRMDMGEEAFQVIDGLGKGYLDTEGFAFQKGKVEAIKQSIYTYDIVYTSDMRAIPRFNEHHMAISQGRSLVEGDRDACVVNEIFLEAYGLSVGDRVSIQLGDRLFHQNPGKGARAQDAESISAFVSMEELEIVGAYRDMDDNWMRRQERGWSYSINTVFVPSGLLPIEVPDDYEPAMGEFSVLVGDPYDIGEFRQAAEPLAAEIGIPMRFSDGGWLGMKDSFEAGRWAASLTAMLSIAGAALALFLAVYLYLGRNRKVYAIMRTLGVPGKKARVSLVLPFFLLSVWGIPAGGMAGLAYTSWTAGEALAGMAANAPYGYVADTALPPGTALLCLLLELAFIFSLTLVFLWKIKKIPPLELLQDGAVHQGRGNRAGLELARDGDGASGADIAKIPEAGGIQASSHRKYPAPCQVAAFIWRRMRRSIGKAAIPLGLAAALMGGVGMFVLARIAYQDAAKEINVKGRALMFSSSSVGNLSSSGLVEDFYCYDSFGVRIHGMGASAPMTFTNDLDRYLAGNYTAAYAPGYDSSCMGSTEAVCLMGRGLAEELGIQPGDRVALLSEDMYTVMSEEYKEEDVLQMKVNLKVRMYQVAGVIDSGAEDASGGIFAPANRVMADVYGQPFPFQYCEFTLSDNRKAGDLDSLLEQEKMLGQMDAPMASFYIDMTGFWNIQRILGLLESLFPVAMAAAWLVSLFGSGLSILQSAREAAFLRVLGAAKKRVRCMLVLEQAALCIAGIILAAGGLALYSPRLFARGAKTMGACWALYFLGCLLGASTAAIQVTRHKILRLLQGKE
ncbi:MAG: hypothetical protein HFH38_02675 [Lachnospiraceae bacterium]|nr:hypothetical protein [Lachnospiraceae bacterium]